MPVGARGTVAELVNNHDAPVSPNPYVATETDAVLKDKTVLGAKADASPDYCAEWKTAPRPHHKGEGSTLAAGSYVKNRNSLWQCEIAKTNGVTR